MNQVLTDEELREAARTVLDAQREDRLPPGGLWAAIAEAGWLGLAVPESLGGLAQPFAVLSLLYEELGRTPAAQPFLGASLGLELLVEAQRHGAGVEALVRSAVAGEAVVVPVALEPQALPAGAAGHLHGVPDAGQATHLLLPTARDGEMVLLLLSLPDPAVVVRDCPTWDRTRCLVDLELGDAALDRGVIILRGAAATAALCTAATHFDLALARDAIGGSDRMLVQTLDYMKARQQFGRAIASFQALKARCADLAMELAAASALVRRACRAATDGDADPRALAAMARLLAGSVYSHVTEEAVQLHGGIGFTWEHDCHVYLKRARLAEVLAGSAAQRKDAVAPALFRAALARQPRSAAQLGDS